MRAWSDCGGDIESRFTKDELLTQIMIYWATESIGTSFFPYYDYANAGALQWIEEGVKNWVEPALLAEDIRGRSLVLELQGDA